MFSKEGVCGLLGPLANSPAFMSEFSRNYIFQSTRGEKGYDYNLVSPHQPYKTHQGSETTGSNQINAQQQCIKVLFNPNRKVSWVNANNFPHLVLSAVRKDELEKKKTRTLRRGTLTKHSRSGSCQKDQKNSKLQQSRVFRKGYIVLSVSEAQSPQRQHREKEEEEMVYPVYSDLLNSSHQ